MDFLQVVKAHNARLADIYARNNVPVIDTFPTRIQVIPTMRCNYRCVMCFQEHSHHASGGEIDFSLLEKLEPVLPFVQEVYFTGGEPLMYSQMPEAIEFLSRFGCTLSMSSNGALLTGKRLEMAFRHMRTIKISLDAATPKTYAWVRRNGDFGQVMRNLTELVKLKVAHNTLLPDLEFGFVAMRSNIHELSRLVVLAHSFGVERIRVAHVHLGRRADELAGESLSEHPDYSDLHMRKAMGVAEELGVRLDMPSLFTPDPAPARKDAPHAVYCYDHGQCHEPWNYLLISQDGATGLCCSNCVAASDLKTKTFAEVWNGPKAQRLRSRLNTANEPPECANCLTYKRSKPKAEDAAAGQHLLPAEPAQTAQ